MNSPSFKAMLDCYATETAGEDFRACAELLGELVPGTGLYDKSVEEAWARSRDSLIQIAGYASQAGKQLALEAIQIVESNLVGNKESLARMVAEMDSPALGAVVDTTHMEKNGETLDEYCEGGIRSSGSTSMNQISCPGGRETPRSRSTSISSTGRAIRGRSRSKSASSPTTSSRIPL